MFLPKSNLYFSYIICKIGSCDVMHHYCFGFFPSTVDNKTIVFDSRRVKYAGLSSCSTSFLTKYTFRTLCNF